MSSIKGGELLLRCLVQENVRVIFAVPDGAYNSVLGKLKENGVRLIPPRHEAAAAHMADAWSRATGEAGVCMAGAGPGTANLLSGIITARSEGSPVIAITAQCASKDIYPDRGGVFQYADQIGLFRSATKWNTYVSDPKRIPELVQKAFRVAMSDRPGPVQLDIPEDVLDAEVDEALAVVEPRQRYRMTQPMAADRALIKEAAALLTEATLPAIYLGGGVRHSGAWSEARRLAEHLACPVLPSTSGRGVLPEDHPLYFIPLSTGGMSARREADVVLLVGTQLGQHENYGRPPIWGLPAQQKIIQVDVDSEAIGRNRPVDLGLVGDAGATLASLLEEVEAITEPRAPSEKLDEFRHQSQAWERNLASLAREGKPIHPAKLMVEVADFFPRDGILVMDGGNTSLYCFQFQRVHEPRSFLWTSEFGHLGTGVPYAMGAKLANPDRPVILVTGDSAFGLNIQELETAFREKLPFICVVNCDYRWGMEVPGQLRAFGADNLVGVDHSRARYDQVAKGFGCFGAYVEDPAEIRPALEAAQKSGLPAVIQVVVDQEANVHPPGLVEFQTIGG
ncbi:MAG: thiamine pyrophosphate-binding protein [Dehalococcoidia bacterium]|nr:MAG: thiamine pyrophosphate-binding protein [Dehalococcoidia bacterium]